MKYTYDPIADAINIVFKKGKVAKTEEVSIGVILDFDKKGEILSLEVLDASRRFGKKRSHEVTFEPLRYSRRQVRELVGAK